MDKNVLNPLISCPMKENPDSVIQGNFYLGNPESWASESKTAQEEFQIPLTIEN